MARKTGFFTDDLFLQHDTGAGHPECAARLAAIRNRLEKTAFFGQFAALGARTASVDEIGLVHEREYVRAVDAFCRRNGRQLDADTVVSAQSYQAAALAAGAGLEAADRILTGEIDRALLLLRPPGHHSLPGRAMGFCLFNNIAVTARYLRSQGVERVAILDWDVHHGNGTEATFYDDPAVFFISLHQYPFYPGTGAAADRGVGPGDGFTLNVPMPRGSDDADYRAAFANTVRPALETFRPEFILISAGFDAHKRDPLAGLALETSSYEWMTRELLDIAGAHSKGRVISFLEGGYDLDALAESVEAHAAALL